MSIFGKCPACGTEFESQRYRIYCCNECRIMNTTRLKSEYRKRARERYHGKVRKKKDKYAWLDKMNKYLRSNDGIYNKKGN